MTEIYKTTNKMISNVRILYNSFERNVAEATITEKRRPSKVYLPARKDTAISHTQRRLSHFGNFLFLNLLRETTVCKPMIIYLIISGSNSILFIDCRNN